MKKEPSVGIVIINWNGKEDTIELIDSIKKINYKNYEIFLVDNASTDGSQSKFLEKYKKNTKINLIFNKSNLGLAGGFNSGLEKTLNKNLDYSFIMNNDMVVDKNFLSLLVTEMKKNKKLAGVGPRIYYYDDRKRIWNTGVKFRLRGFKILNQGKMDFELSSENKFVDALDGAYLMRNSILKKIGLLEKDFFIMQEMTGWCIRAKKYGYLSSIVPKSKIWHKVSSSVQNASKICAYYGDRNWLLLLKRTRSKFDYFIGVLMHLILFFPRMFYSLIKGKKFLVKERIKGIIDSFLI